MMIYAVMNHFVDRTNPYSINYNVHLDSIWSTRELAKTRIDVIRSLWIIRKRPCVLIDDSDPNMIVIQMTEKSQTTFYIEERELDQRPLEFDEKHPGFEM